MARNKYDVDEIIEEQFDVHQLLRLGKYVAPHKKKMFLAAVLMLSSSALTMLIPIFFMRVIDQCIPERDMNGIIRYSILSLLLILYSVVTLKAKIQITNQVGQSVIHQLRTDLFAHLQELPFSYYDNRPHGKIQVRVVNYVNNLSDLLSNGLINTITDLCSLIFIIGFMVSINWKLTLMCMCGLPVLALFAALIKRRQHLAWQIQSNKQSNLNAYIAESINGVRVTQSFVREEKNREIMEQTEKLNFIAHHDTLTGIWNRNYLEQWKEKYFLSPAKERAVAVFMADIDHFKHYNDRFGHVLGDECLKRVAQTLKETGKEKGFLFRFGGEEFLYVLEGPQKDESRRLAEQMCTAVVEEKISSGMEEEGKEYVTVSIGYTEGVMRTDEEFRSLLRKADQALYYVKNSGRNRAAAYEELPEK